MNFWIIVMIFFGDDANLPRPILGLRHSFGSSLPRLCPSTLAEDTPAISSAPGKSNQHLNRHSGPFDFLQKTSAPLVKKGIDYSIMLSPESERSKSFSRSGIMQPYYCTSFACVSTKCIETTEENSTKEVLTDTSEHVWSPSVFKNSTHRDGAIYENTLLKKEWFGFDFTDRNETRLEPMMLTKTTKGCVYYQGFCRIHFPKHILQFFSLTLAKSPVSSGPIQLYGYIAVRDERDCMLNYVFNHSRDDPVFVQQGSLIEMTGPKRAILMPSTLVEFDMRIKNGEQEEDDLQLIDGAMACNNLIPWKPIKHRITGQCGIVDMSVASIENAVEATIEIVILEVQKCFSLSLSSYIYVMEDYEEIPLFHGTIDQSHGLKRFVVAVMLDTGMLLKFKVGNDVIRYRTFKAKQHGCASRRIKLEFASFVMKVTWSTIW